MAADLITQLRDIYYPMPIPIWPLAVGWYCLMGLGLFLFALTFLIWNKKSKRNKLRKIVLRRLAELQNQQQHTHNISRELSMLLKRVVLANYPRHEVAGLHGEAWLQFLDKTSVTKGFSEGPGRLLIVSPYQAKSDPLPDALFHLIQSWVKKNL
jgi:hypothetical protein